MKFLKFSALALLLLPALCFCKESDVYIGVSSKYNPESLPKVGITNFFPKDEANEEERKAAIKLSSVIRSDLLRSRYFDVEDNLPKPNLNNLSKTFAKYRSEGIDYLLFAEVGQTEENQWNIKAFLYDTESQKAILAKNLKSSNKTLRRSAHIFSDQIVKLLMGKRGIADTRIAFANDSTGRKEIYMVDYDGYNLVRLTRDNSIALLPRWSNDATKIFYTTYRNRNPDVFYVDLKEGKIKPLIKNRGLNLIGGVAPDDKSLVLTLSRGENPNIYVKDLESGAMRRLTDKYGVDGSPSYSPDGKFITFVSNRSGNPQIYIMNLATQETRRITKMNWTDTPQWSPNGDWIVFAGRQAPNHPIDIFITDITGSQVRQLTADAGWNEDPTWSPDGRFIAFTTTRAGKRQIYVMDADGSAPHLIANIKGNAFTPSWSK